MHPPYLCLNITIVVHQIGPELIYSNMHPPYLCVKSKQGPCFCQMLLLGEILSCH